jgi:NADH dehydrogenase
MIADALEADEHVGQTYEIGGPDVLTLREVVELVYEAEGKSVSVVGLPMALAGVGLSVMDVVPGMPMGKDQYRSLQFDNTTSDNDVAAFGADDGRLTAFRAYLGV